MTAPSTPRLSKKTRARVRQWPGPLEDRLVDRVGVEVLRAAGHERDRAGRCPAPRAGRRTATPAVPRARDHGDSAMPMDSGATTCSASSGCRTPASASPTADRWPAGHRRTTEPMASTISGTVMTAGDSCGWTSSVPARPAEEGHDQQPGHVERGQPGAEQRGDAEDSPGRPPRSKAASMIGSLVKKPDSGGIADDRQPAEAEGRQGDLHVLPQPAEAADVDLVVHRVHDRTGAEEQAGLEEAVREQVDDGQRVRRPARARRRGTCSRSGRPSSRRAPA